MLSQNIHYIGVNDHAIDLFEGQYRVPDGMSYNSYVITDEKIAVIDTVDLRLSDIWFNKLRAVLGERQPDYLLVQHMEPDHSGSIFRFAQRYPEARIVASAQAFKMMQGFFGTDFAERRLVVAEGDTLPLGAHTLHFITAAMVHWPEVIMSYEAESKTLFSADAFGRFGALDRPNDDWVTEARRYYIGIVGKYGVQVQAVLKKAAALDIQRICPLHGPALEENLGYYIGLYNSWSSYTPEEDGVMIAYTSVYGHTARAAMLLADKLRVQGTAPVIMHDLARCDMHAAVADAFRRSKLVLATTTYNNDIFPFMREFIGHLTARNFTKRSVAFVENGSWAPTAAKTMKAMFEKSKDLQFVEPVVTLRSALSDENAAQLSALAEALS